MDESEQRRETFRVGLDRAAVIRGEEGTRSSARLGDLSIDGARLMGDLGLRLGERLSLVVSLDGEDLELAGRVVRVFDSGAGIRFDGLTPAAETRIARFLTEQQRRRVRPRA